MNGRNLIFGGVALAVAVFGLLAWLAFEWRSTRQIEKATVRLLSAVENRDWKKVIEMTSEDYTDEWGNNRADAVRGASEVFRQFFFLVIEPSEMEIRVDGQSAEVEMLLRIQGNGTGLAQVAMGRINDVDSKFVFRWRKESWKPWDWRLYSAANPELRLNPRSYF